MKSETVDKIVAAADDLGLEVAPYRGYSGRAMYGKKTDGVEYECLGDLLATVAAAAFELTAGGKDNAGAIEDFIKDIRRIRTDNLGLRFIAY